MGEPRVAAETRTAVFEVHDDLVVVRVRPGAEQALADARDNLATSAALSGTSRRGLLIDIRRCPPLAPEVRHFYSGEPLAAFRALGLLVNATPLGRMMGNVYLRIARIGVPARLFEGEDEAVAWLRSVR